MELRDYQEEAVRWLVPRWRGFIKAPAGSGKTLIGACAIAYRVLAKVRGDGFVYSDSNPPCRVVWVANTIEQCQQAAKAIESVPGPQFADVRVACAASMPDLSKADIVVFDEAHHCPAETWKALIMQVRPEAVLWGFSATPFGDDELRNALVQAAFRDFFTIERSRLEAAGHLEKGKVYMHDVDTYGEYDAEIERLTVIETRIRTRRFPLVSPAEHYRRAKWQVTQEFIQKNEQRTNTIIRLCNSTPESTLLLVGSIEYGAELVAKIPDSAMAHSKLSKKCRSGIIQNFRDGSLRVCVATSLADEGLDVPRASVLVLAMGGRAAGRLEQRAGRVLRPSPGKTGGMIHDFLDRASVFGYAQARARMAVYSRLGYEPEVVSVK